MTDTIVDFLHARIDKDERVASRAARGPWSSFDTDLIGTDGVIHDGAYGEPLAVADARHIVRWDPIRVLRECGAKRRIIAAHPSDAYADEPTIRFCMTCASSSWGRPLAFPCPTLCALAQPYADHPDFQEAWRV